MSISVSVAESRKFEWLDQLTHPSARSNPVELARQKHFVAARLAIGVCVLGFSPIWVLFLGAPTLQHAAQFILGLTSLGSVAVLRHTGKLRLAQYVSICGWAVLATSIATLTQGSEAVSLLLMTIALIEATLASSIIIIAAVVGSFLAMLSLEVGLDASIQHPQAPRLQIVLWLSPLLVYLAALTFTSVLSERARAKAEQRNLRDLRLLTQTLGDIVVHFDQAGSVLSILGNIHQTYGLEASDLGQRGFFQRVHVADRPALLKLISDVVTTNVASHTVLRVNVARLISAQVGYAKPIFKYFDARACPIESQDAKADEPRAICILRDVTAAQLAEEEVARARQESERAMAAKTRFLANVSHELRTPLNAIIGFSEMLASEELEPTEPEKRREYSKIVAESGHHLHDIVSSILDMSKIESGTMQILPEPFRLPELLKQCCDMMQIKADHGGVKLVQEFGENFEEIIADRRACKQILLNLLSNAVKFTPTNGSVTLSLRQEGNSFVISVCDTGVGIATSDLAHLGDPFFQANSGHDRSFEGTGLGLSVVRGLVGLHGGRICIESGPSSGTTVIVRLPQDCRLHQERASPVVKIDTIARHGAATQGRDVVFSQEDVKKIA